MTFKHFAIEERETMQEMLWQKASVRSIARVLGRSPSSVSREIARNKPPLRKRYTPRLAHERAFTYRTFRGRTLRLKSGFIKLSKLSERTAKDTNRSVERRLQEVSVDTLTLDNGSENQYWQELEQVLGIKVYHAHPYNSFERGSNENANGLVRWYFPKGTNFANISDEAIQRVEDALNNRPRKRLGWRTPLEVFNESVAIRG